MKKNNPNYYSLEFHDKQVTLNEYATWDSVDFDISGIVGNAAGIAKSLGSAALSMTQLTGYLVKNLAIALTPEEYRKKIREEYEELKKKIQIEKSKKGFWNTFVDGMSKDSRKVFRRIEDNISSLDRRSQQMFRDAGLSESQTLALLFSTNPAIVLADYLKIKFEDDPRSESADKTIDSIEKAIANSLIDSIKGRQGKDNIVNHCKNKIINGSNIEAKYVILKDLQNLITKWINQHIADDSSKILYNISSKSLEKTSTGLKNNASNNKPQDSLDLIKAILQKINSQKNESSNQFNLMFNNTTLLLTEASRVTATRSVLFNSIAWLILETSNADLLKEEMDILNESNEIVKNIKQYIKKYLSDEESKSDSDEINITDEESNEDQDVNKSNDNINEFAAQIKKEVINVIATSKAKEETRNDFDDKCDILVTIYLLYSSLDNNFESFKTSLKEKINKLHGNFNSELKKYLVNFLSSDSDDYLLDIIPYLTKLDVISKLIKDIKALMKEFIGEDVNPFLKEALNFDYGAALSEIIIDV